MKTPSVFLLLLSDSSSWNIKTPILPPCHHRSLSKLRSSSDTKNNNNSNNNNNNNKRHYIPPPSTSYPTVIDHQGRTWRCNNELLESFSLQRDSMMYTPLKLPNGTFIPWDAHLGPGQSMLRRKAGLGQVPHFEEDDERWMHHYERLVDFKSKFGHTDVPLKYRLDLILGLWCNRQRFQYSLLRDRKKALISEWRIAKLDQLGFSFSCYSKWEERIAQLRIFRDVHGHLKVPKGYDDDPGLYLWMKGQRKEYNAFLKRYNSTITLEKKNQLDELGFDWNPKETSWKDKFKQLQKFKAEYGHCNVPYNMSLSANSTILSENAIQDNSEDEDDDNSNTLNSLSRWITRQREQYKQHQMGHKLQHAQTNSSSPTSSPSPVLEDRFKKLESIGLEWDTTDAQWNRQLKALENFQKEHGHCHVPMNHKASNAPSLGKWVSAQRQYFKEEQNGITTPLSPQRKDRLDQTGFVWDVSESVWHDNYKKLEKFEVLHGHCDVPWGYENDQSLWNWVNWQRKQYKLLVQHKKSTITETRMKLLQDMGFQWDVFENEWNKRYQELSSFRDQYDHCNVPKGTQSITLYNWVMTQRRQYKKMKRNHPSSMTDERIEKLEHLKFVWDAKDALWKERYTQLCGYKESSGDCRVPINFKENPQLGKWVSTQRTQFRNRRMGVSSTLTDERVEVLEGIEFEWSLRQQ